MDQPTANARPRDRSPAASRPEADQIAAATSRQVNSDTRPAESGRAGQRRFTERQQTDAISNTTAEPARNDHRRIPARASGTDTIGLPPRPDAARNPDRQRLAERLERLENPSTSRDGLRDRLNQLEPGHPSSPWHEDGSPRPPAPRLSDLEHPKPPLTDTEYAEHKSEVVQKLDAARAAGLTTDRFHALGPDHKEWSLERIKIHKEILTEKWNEAASIPCEGKAIIAGGLGGSGKTTVLEQYRGSDSPYLNIDPDSFKEALAKRGLIPEIPGLSPMESSDLAHEESSYLARQLARMAVVEGKNLIWDITVSSYDSVRSRTIELQEAGYEQIDGVFVQIPIETSVMRSEARHRHGCDLHLDGKGYGGRYVPAEVIRAQSDQEYGSINRRAFEQIKDSFTNWALYDNSVDGRGAVLIDSSTTSDNRHGKDEDN